MKVEYFPQVPMLVRKSVFIMSNEGLLIGMIF